MADPIQDLVAVIEGRLLSKDNNKVTIEISDGVVVTISGDKLESFEVLEDDNTGRPFIQMQIGEDEDMNLDVKPQILVDALRSKELPLTFATQEGMAFASGPLPTFPGLAPIPDHPGSGSEGGEWEDTRSIFMTCQINTRTLFGIVCDRQIGDINFVDDRRWVPNEPSQPTLPE